MQTTTLENHSFANVLPVHYILVKSLNWFVGRNLKIALATYTKMSQTNSVHGAKINIFRMLAVGMCTPLDDNFEKRSERRILLIACEFKNYSINIVALSKLVSLVKVK